MFDRRITYITIIRWNKCSQLYENVRENKYNPQMGEGGLLKVARNKKNKQKNQKK